MFPRALLLVAVIGCHSYRLPQEGEDNAAKDDTTDVRAHSVWSSALEPRTVISGQPAPSGISVRGGYVYYTCIGNPIGDGSVRRVAKSGGAPEILATGQKQPVEPFADDTAVWWLNRGIGQNTGALMRFVFATRTTEAIRSDVFEPRSLTVTPDRLFWIERAYSATGVVGAVLTMSWPSGSVVTLHDQLNAPHSMSLVGDELYLRLGMPGYLAVAGNNKGSAIAPVAAADSPIATVATGSRVYWGTAGGELRRRAAGKVDTLATGVGFVWVLGLGPANLYWGAGEIVGVPGRIGRVSLDGSKTEVVTRGLVSPTGIAVDSGTVFVADFDAGSVFALPE